MLQHPTNPPGITPQAAQQQETEEQQLLNKINANISRQLEILTWLEGNVPVWKELLSLRMDYASDTEALSAAVKKQGIRVGPVYPKQIDTEYYEPTPFLQIAIQRGLYQEMCQLGVIKFEIDKQRAREYLVRDPEAADQFKQQCWVSKPKYVATYGMPKQPDVVPVAETRKGSSTPAPSPVQP